MAVKKTLDKSGKLNIEEKIPGRNDGYLNYSHENRADKD
jgi:hypothetical protein